MPILSRLPAPGSLIVAALALGALPTAASAQVERRLEQTFQVRPGSVVTVKISGGSIQIDTGRQGVVDARLTERFEVSSETDADRVLEDFDISLTEHGGNVVLIARRKPGRSWSSSGRGSNVRLSATLTVPADVSLDLDTSGGAITVRGERTADLNADTSGGSIQVDGGEGRMRLDTSGGSITVRRALSTLDADTSGGSIQVDYVGPAATHVSVDTSGGSIDIGIDPAAKLSIDASTSGGGVSVLGLPFSTRSLSRSRASGTMNGGGGQLSADTSGGHIQIHAARD